MTGVGRSGRCLLEPLFRVGALTRVVLCGNSVLAGDVHTASIAACRVDRHGSYGTISQCIHLAVSICFFQRHKTHRILLPQITRGLWGIRTKSKIPRSTSGSRLSPADRDHHNVLSVPHSPGSRRGTGSATPPQHGRGRETQSCPLAIAILKCHLEALWSPGTSWTENILCSSVDFPSRAVPATPDPLCPRLLALPREVLSFPLPSCLQLKQAVEKRPYVTRRNLSELDGPQKRNRTCLRRCTCQAPTAPFRPAGLVRRARLRACASACVRVCVRACLRARLRARVHVFNSRGFTVNSSTQCLSWCVCHVLPQGVVTQMSDFSPVQEGGRGGEGGGREGRRKGGRGSLSQHQSPFSRRKLTEAIIIQDHTSCF